MNRRSSKMLFASVALVAVFIAIALLVAALAGRPVAIGALVTASPTANAAVAAQPVAPTFTIAASVAPNVVAAAQPVPERLRYAAIGASDTVGMGTANPAAENWTAQLAGMLPEGTEYQRFARSGITLGQALTREIPSAIEYQPNVVTMWLVVNDAIQGVQPVNYSKQLRQALDQLTNETDATILLFNAPDLSSILHPEADENAKLQLRSISQAWNKIINDTVAPYAGRVVVVDLFAASQAAADHRDWISPDGFHPSVVGYSELAQVAYSAMKGARLVQ